MGKSEVTLEFRYEEIIKQACIDYITSNQGNFHEELNEKIERAKYSWRELFTICINHRKRIPVCKPREVFYAKDFKTTLSYRKYRVKTNELIMKLENGDCVKDYLSKLVDTVYVPTEKRTKENGELRLRKDLDFLLNVFGIHHLHIDKSLPRENYPLLFCIIEDNTVAILDILPHPNGDDWFNIACEKLVSMAEKNWNYCTKSRKIMEIQDATNVEGSYTFRDLKNGHCGAIKIDDKIYFTAISTAKYHIGDTNLCDNYLCRLKNLSEELEKNKNALYKAVKKVGDDSAGNNLVFELIFDIHNFDKLDYFCEIREINTDYRKKVYNPNPEEIAKLS